MSQPPEKKVSEQILEEIAKLNARLDSLTTSQKHEVSLPAVPTGLPDEAQPKGHQTPEEMAACPNCYPKVKPIVLKQYAEELKGQEVVQCKGCGLNVKKSEEKCPACGGTSAR